MVYRARECLAVGPPVVERPSPPVPWSYTWQCSYGLPRITLTVRSVQQPASYLACPSYARARQRENVPEQQGLFER
jgi:hypothetical protein